MPGVNRKEQRRLEAKAREEKAAKLKPLKAEFAAIEIDIAKLEAEKATLTQQLADPGFFQDAGDAPKAMKRFSEIETILTIRYSKWGDLSDRLEKADTT